MNLQDSSNLYTEFLLCQTSQASATMCSNMLDNVVKHDSFSRMLKLGNYGSTYIWSKAKTVLKSLKDTTKILSLDNTIIHKPDSKVNEVVNWFYDHSKGRAVKGINLISALLHTPTANIPVGFELQTKDQLVVEQDKHGNDRFKRKARYSINQLARKLVLQVLKNVGYIDYIVGDRYFASKDNVKFFNKHKVKFVLGICSNRLVARSKSDANAGNYRRIDELELSDHESMKVFLKGIKYSLVVTRQVYKNADNSIGEIYLITNNLNLQSNHIEDIYQKRWNIETYHRSLKQNVSLAKSPTSVIATQLNHIGLSIGAFIELEKIKLASGKNHYALKRKMLIAANQASYREIIKMKNMLKTAS
ncbi:IS701 family transposase [Francisella philomiragia]|uniref:IS701 family transposase n=1 Tax=Francisella philomiragia TaxID=28110 RepID=UPI001908CB1A|nr:transposase [Francisella philomiragia]MBK2105436.1 transposase [Francisella philomiragia]